MRVLGFGTYDVSAHPRIGTALSGLAGRGWSCEQVNVPLRFSTADRVRLLQRPWTAYRLLIRLVRCWFVLARRGRAAVRRFAPDAILVGYLGVLDILLARVLFPGSMIVLDQLIFLGDTATDRGVQEGARTRGLRAIDRLAMRCADLIMVDTEENARLVPGRFSERVVVVPVGADSGWFIGAAPEEPAQAGPLTVIFFGLFTPLQGTGVIGEAIASLGGRSDIRFTLVGRGQDLPDARRASAGASNVDWRDWVPAEELPDVVRAHDVCLGIFGTTVKSMRVVPNKVFQGAASGCAILTSDTPPQRRALGDAAFFVPAGDAAALAAALDTLTADRGRLHELRTAAWQRSRSSFAPTDIAAALDERIRAHRLGAGHPARTG